MNGVAVGVWVGVFVGVAVKVVVVVGVGVCELVIVGVGVVARVLHDVSALTIPSMYAVNSRHVGSGGQSIYIDESNDTSTYEEP